MIVYIGFCCAVFTFVFWWWKMNVFVENLLLYLFVCAQQIPYMMSVLNHFLQYNFECFKRFFMVFKVHIQYCTVFVGVEAPGNSSHECIAFSISEWIKIHHKNQSHTNVVFVLIKNTVTIQWYSLFKKWMRFVSSTLRDTKIKRCYAI